MNFETEIILSISSKLSILYIITEEEQRLEYILSKISQKIFKTSIAPWDFINGYSNKANQSQQAIRNPLQALEVIEQYNYNTKIFLLKDFHVFLNDSSIIRKIKNLKISLKQTNHYIIISAYSKQIPSILSDYIHILNMPLPNEYEIEMEVKKILSMAKINSSERIKSLTSAYKGFSINKIRESLSHIILSNISFDESISYIEQEKRKIIQQTDILDFYPRTHNIKDLGGLYNLKKWLNIRKNAFSDKAQNYGLPHPKGLLLVGIQGTGKSLSAKAISQEWNLPLFKLDISKIFASLVGESENRLRKAIAMSEQCKPCILWIDEIDKAFTKEQSFNDSNTSNRVLGILLTWLSEKKSSVFIVATANSLTSLPTEITRKGRFDEIFFLDLPQYPERTQIFKIHLQKIRPLTWFNYDIDYLSKITNKFSGAEIEQVIIEAMYYSFDESREFTTQDIIKSIKQTVPISFVDQDQIKKLQEWAYSGKVRLA